MMRTGLIVAALGLYALVLACVLWPTPAPADPAPGAVPDTHATRSASELLPLRGVALQIQRVDWLDKYKQCIDEIADVGANTVSLVVDTRQENGTSSRIYLDMRMTPTPEMLGALIDHAKSKGLKVMLMPIVLLDNPRGTEWRGTLKPESWDDWWESYRQMISHFAWIAEGHDVDVLVVGSELVSTETQLDEWTKTISDVRKIYHGLLTYSANWDHYSGIEFWDQLDLIGMNSYWSFASGSWTPGAEKDVTVASIKERWKKIQLDLLPFIMGKDKPLLFTEVGWCSMANMAHEPWDYTKPDPKIDLDLQKRLYRGFFESWQGNPHLGGFMVWEWPPGDGGADHRGYTPKNKPAEEVLREWMGREWE